MAVSEILCVAIKQVFKASTLQMFSLGDHCVCVCVCVCACGKGGGFSLSLPPKDLSLESSVFGDLFRDAAIRSVWMSFGGGNVDVQKLAAPEGVPGRSTSPVLTRPCAA